MDISNTSVISFKTRSRSFFVTSLNRCDNAGIQMVFKDFGTNLVERGLNSLNLADHIDTIGILLHHADHSAQMPFNGL